MIYKCNFHVLSHLLLIYICKLHWNQVAERQAETGLINPTLPDGDELDLQWVYGYRGFDCRNNLHMTENGDVVYPAAALGIVLQGDDSGNALVQKYFRGYSR